MKQIADMLKRLLRITDKPERQPMTEEELRAAFRTAYHSFKLLLTANNRSLEIMTEIEGALTDDRPFGMSFVRSKATALCVNVFRMVAHLDELAPGKYAPLFSRFEAIQSELEEILGSDPIYDGAALAIPLSEVDIDMVDLVGPKMANIAELGNKTNITVPPGFVLTSAAYRKLMETEGLQTEVNRRIQAAQPADPDTLYALSSSLQQLVIDAPLPEEIERAVMDSYRDLERRTAPGIRVSVRSSAVAEDRAGGTFAGQFRSLLNVSPDNLVLAYKEVLASVFGVPATAYRLAQGIPDEAAAMSVGFMAMVDAVTGGVTYTRDPFDSRNDSILISAVWGLPKAVVDGTVDPDVFVVARHPELHVKSTKVGLKAKQFRCDPEEGVCRMELTDHEAAAACLSDSRVLELAQTALEVEEYYGTGQDIEWAIDREGRVIILQCRPLGRETPNRLITDEDSVQEDGAAVLMQGGVRASSGVASGPVFKVLNESDKLGFPSDAVMVTRQALPTWASLLSRASAVITETGEVTSHLANVAREFGVPALFGVKGATETLENGEVITVDADAGKLYAGKIESLIASVAPKKSLMEGSTVYETLRKVTERTVPLTLIDPQSPDFKPENCRTLHDITRFVHEKSVEEMFGFGKDRRFSHHAAKQLMGDVPMQWWVINLDDGFTESVPGKFVRIEDIASEPMLALWRGMTAIPWGGPPPMNAGGFMSVLMEATTNPGLDPALASPYAVRNYFMISRNFCSLASRFGFHFSTVEALVDERPRENYVSFVFTGGAADKPRRIRRAFLVAGILEEFHFQVTLKEDSVFSRLEGHPKDFMESRLEILGFLIMHTRQLDMAMEGDNSVWAYRNQLTRQIQEVLLRKNAPDSEVTIT